MYMRWASEEDRKAIGEEIAKDPYHNKLEGFTPDVFLNTKSVVFGDDDGDVLYVNVRNVALATIQFADVDKERVRKVIMSAFPSFSEGLRKSGATGIIYESESPGLIWFLRRFGFKAKRFFMKGL